MIRFQAGFAALVCVLCSTTMSVPGQPWRVFVPPDVRNHLIIVVVAVQASNRFDVAAEFLVELIDKHDRQPRPAEFSGNPLIPACDHHKRWVEFEGTLPLLAEVVAVVQGTRRDVLLAIMKATAGGASTKA